LQSRKQQKQAKSNYLVHARKFHKNYKLTRFPNTTARVTSATNHSWTYARKLLLDSNEFARSPSELPLHVME